MIWLLPDCMHLWHVATATTLHRLSTIICDSFHFFLSILLIFDDRISVWWFAYCFAGEIRIYSNIAHRNMCCESKALDSTLTMVTAAWKCWYLMEIFYVLYLGKILHKTLQMIFSFSLWVLFCIMYITLDIWHLTVSNVCIFEFSNSLVNMRSRWMNIFKREHTVGMLIFQ